MEIAVAHPDQSDALTEIAFEAKRPWGYPESRIDVWRDDLVVTPE